MTKLARSLLLRGKDGKVSFFSSEEMSHLSLNQEYNFGKMNGGEDEEVEQRAA